jgi:hypothetical protein
MDYVLLLLQLIAHTHTFILHILLNLSLWKLGRSSDWLLPSNTYVLLLLQYCWDSVIGDTLLRMLTTQLHLVPRSKNTSIYTSTRPVRLHGVVLG